MMMTESMRSTLKHLIVDHEGYERFPYPDTKGYITIGIGYNLSTRGLSDNWINNQYEEDVRYFYNQLTEDFKWFRILDEIRQMVLIDMCFMGYKAFKSFKKLLAAMEISDYRTAAYEIMNSKWAIDVKPGRARKLHDMMLHGEL